MNKVFILSLAVLAMLACFTQAQVESRGLTVQKWDDDSEYNGTCSPTIESIPEICSTIPEVEREWKQALSCGWRNDYDSFKIARKGVQDAYQWRSGYVGTACIAATIHYKTGSPLCTIFEASVCHQHHYAGFLNERGDTWEGYKNSAEEAVTLSIPSFDHARDCPGELNCSQPINF